MPGSGSPAASLVGRFLVAAPSMPDERFQKSVVFICKHDDDGALGIIVNTKVEDLPLGHSGWAPGQLDREMQDNAWLVVDGDAGLVFDPDFAAKWQRALDRLS